jgi:hypothetical protein
MRQMRPKWCQRGRIDVNAIFSHEAVMPPCHQVTKNSPGFTEIFSLSCSASVILPTGCTGYCTIRSPFDLFRNVRDDIISDDWEKLANRRTENRWDDPRQQVPRQHDITESQKMISPSFLSVDHFLLVSTAKTQEPY